MKQGNNLTIDNIERTVNLIKKVNCQNYAMVTETASEMGEKKTALMQFIEDNPRLFTLVEVEKPKKGLAIKFVYDSAEKNPATDEWVKAMKESWKNKIQVFGKYYYGVLEFYYIDNDDVKASWREGLWRNTKEKIQKLIDEGLLKKSTRGYGGFGDYHHWEGYQLDIETTNALKEAGWELIYPKE